LTSSGTVSSSSGSSCGRSVRSTQKRLKRTRLRVRMPGKPSSYTLSSLSTHLLVLRSCFHSLCSCIQSVRFEGHGLHRESGGKFVVLCMHCAEFNE
jgi:hypothetical protein